MRVRKASAGPILRMQLSECMLKPTEHVIHVVARWLTRGSNFERRTHNDVVVAAIGKRAERDAAEARPCRQSTAYGARMSHSDSRLG